jgi:hypothetical protein
MGGINMGVYSRASFARNVLSGASFRGWIYRCACLPFGTTDLVLIKWYSTSGGCAFCFMSIWYDAQWTLVSSNPMPVAARSKAWVCGRSLAGIAGLNPAGGNGCLSFVSVVCWQVEVSAWGWSPVQRSRNECGVCMCDRESSIIRGFWPTRECCTIKIKVSSNTSFVGNIANVIK